MKRYCLNCKKEIERKKYVKYEHMKYCSTDCSYLFREKNARIYSEFRKNHCEICGCTEGNFEHNHNSALAVHHKDFNCGNNSKNNLLTVCKTCHGCLHRKNT